MLKIRYTKQFKKDYNAIKKREYDLGLLDEVLAFLINGKELPNKYKDHQLAGNFKGYR